MAVPWGMQHYSQLAFHPEASEYARYIVEACEKDPKTTTALEMDNLDARLECTKCKGLIGLQWRQAVTHAVLKTGHTQSDFKMHEPNKTTEIKELEKDSTYMWSSWSRLHPWRCKACRNVRRMLTDPCCIDGARIIRNLDYPCVHEPILALQPKSRYCPTVGEMSRV